MDGQVTIISSVIGTGVALAFGLWKIGNSLKKEVDDKIRRNYKRLDEVKEIYDTKVNKIREEQLGKVKEVMDETDERYVQKDTCIILHKQIDARLADIASDVKVLIKNGSKYQGNAGARGPKGARGLKGKNGRNGKA
jgi:hypothetical protein